MDGDSSQRFCTSCNRHVHDLSNLTRRQAAELMENSPGGLCARLTLDPRGQILFRDPPTNWTNRLVQVSLLGLSTLALPAKAGAQSAACRVQVKVTDPSGAAVPRATVKFSQGQDSVAKIGATNNDGLFNDELPAGRYTLGVESPGFMNYRVDNLESSCDPNTPINIDVRLNIGGSLMGEVVIVEGHESPLRKVQRKSASLFRRIRQLI
jgi:hypothetical protein